MCREAYDKILFHAPELVVVQFRRKNLCRCLGHRHPVMRKLLHAIFGVFKSHQPYDGAKLFRHPIPQEVIAT